MLIGKCKCNYDFHLPEEVSRSSPSKISEDHPLTNSLTHPSRTSAVTFTYQRKSHKLENSRMAKKRGVWCQTHPSPEIALFCGASLFSSCIFFHNEMGGGGVCQSATSEKWKLHGKFLIFWREDVATPLTPPLSEGVSRGVTLPFRWWWWQLGEGMDQTGGNRHGSRRDVDFTHTHPMSTKGWMIVEVTKGVSDRQTVTPPSSPHHSPPSPSFFFL